MRGRWRRPSGPEPFVERVNGSHLGGGREAGLLIDHGNQVLHLNHLLWFGAPLVGGHSPLLRMTLPRSDTACRISLPRVMIDIVIDTGAQVFTQTIQQPFRVNV
jgi:hypothetical protein